MMPEGDSKPEQRISGLYRLVTNPWFYETFQNMLGASRARRRFFSEWVETDADKDVLDIGCGPGIALPHIAYRSYFGIDLNAAHIERARAQNVPNARFETGAAQDVLIDLDESFDVILVLGFLHHLDDHSVGKVCDEALARLRPGGSMFFLEPVYLPDQNSIARKLKDLDSGLHIRTPEGYMSLLERDGCILQHRVSNDLLRVPYSHFWGRLTRGV